MIDSTSTKAHVTRTGNIYTAPGADGMDVRPLVMGEMFLATKEREGRWARLATTIGKHVGFTKAKRLTTDRNCIPLTTLWGYVDPKHDKRKGVTRDYAAKFAETETTPVKVGADDGTAKVVASGCDLVADGHLVASEIVGALNELAEKAENRLEEPSRSRFAFFDRFCALRERNHTSGATDQSVSLASARYNFASTLIRWGVAGATLAYVANSALSFLG